MTQSTECGAGLVYDDRNVPADSNFAERTLRPAVIARKVSFSSQSDAGAKAHEILMSVL